MNIKHVFIIILLLSVCAEASGVTARKGVYTLRQPDGSTIQVQVSGDEFYHLMTTTDGCVVVKDKDGYYCYAAFSPDGTRRSSGRHVSTANSGSAEAAASRAIPYNAIRRLSAGKRMNAARIRSLHTAPVTKGGQETTHNLIILAQFPDLPFMYSRSNFVNMLTQHGYSDGGASGSALDYFNDQFEGTLQFDFEVSGIVTMSRDHAYYGANDEDGQDIRAAELVAEACRLVDPDIDFSRFDGDGDGKVDNVFVFVAGPSESEGADEEYFWPHNWGLIDAGIRLTLDGKKIDTYCMATERVYSSQGRERMATIGTFCHEYSHSLGLSDHYDTDYESSGGESAGLWFTTDLMDGGNYNNDGNTPPNYNAPELEAFGIGKAEALSVGSYTLAPVSKEKRYFRAETDTEGEYYLFECRDNSLWDKYIGGAGMLIYHVDKSKNSAGYSDTYEMDMNASQRWYYNEVNCNPDHQCLDLVECLTLATDAYKVFWPNSIHTSFSPSTSPAFQFWNGNTPDISISGITKSDGSIKFSAVGPLSIEKIEEFQDGAIVQWSSTSVSNEGCISVSDPSGKSTEYTVRAYSPGKFSYTLEGLSPKTTYKVSVFSRSDRSTKVSSEFTTKPYYQNGYPFIYLNSADRYDDGSFRRGSTMPLKVFNAKDAVRVSWDFSSTTLTTDGSGYYTVIGNGTVKARIDYKDGTWEVISKKITVK